MIMLGRYGRRKHAVMLWMFILSLLLLNLPGKLGALGEQAWEDLHIGVLGLDLCSNFSSGWLALVILNRFGSCLSCG